MKTFSYEFGPFHFLVVLSSTWLSLNLWSGPQRPRPLFLLECGFISSGGIADSFGLACSYMRCYWVLSHLIYLSCLSFYSSRTGWGVILASNGYYCSVALLARACAVCFASLNAFLFWWQTLLHCSSWSFLGLIEYYFMLLDHTSF